MSAESTECPANRESKQFSPPSKRKICPQQQIRYSQTISNVHDKILLHMMWSNAAVLAIQYLWKETEINPVDFIMHSVLFVVSSA